MNTRTCVDCGADISDRSISAYLCVPCAKARLVVQNRRRVRTPEQLEAKRRYQREWARGRVCSVRIERCEACLELYTAHGPGGRRFCYPCAVFYDRERHRYHHAIWARKYRARERLKANARRRRRLRRAA